MSQDPHVWIARSRRGHEAFASTDGWGHKAACEGDERFIQRNLPDEVLDELIDVCNTVCEVRARCLQWAIAQTQPVGFSVAGGRRWKAWNNCAICGKKVRGIDRCTQHMDMEAPTGTILKDGTGREYKVSDEH